jgi:hypothetical protein
MSKPLMKRSLYRFAFTLAVLAAASSPVSVWAGPGLAERRAMAHFQEQKFPDLKRRLDEAAGFELPVEVDWDSLMLEDMGEQYLDDFYIADIFFHPLVAALKSITKDEMGRKALKAGLKKVVILYDPDTAPITNYEKGWLFEEKVLTLNYRPGTNSGGRDDANFKERVAVLTKILEKKL